MKRLGLLLSVVLLGALWAGTAGTSQRVAVGDRLPDFTLPRLDGQPLDLRASLGPKATVLVFWASWSPRSAEVLSDMQIFYKKHGRGTLQVVAVNVDHEAWDPADAPRLEAYLADEGVTFPVVLDAGLSVCRGYGLTAVPSMLLVNAEGTVTELLPGYPETLRVEFLTRILEALGLAAPRGQEEPPPPPVATRESKAGSTVLTGKVLLRKGRRVDAEAAFRAAIRLDPEYLEAYEALAETLERSGHTEEAAEVRRKAEGIIRSSSPGR